MTSGSEKRIPSSTVVKSSMAEKRPARFIVSPPVREASESAGAAYQFSARIR
jgi:hypothetical protein